MRKNYGCKYFWVGRDHAGIKDFYGIYDSQKFCKKIGVNAIVLGVLNLRNEVDIDLTRRLARRSMNMEVTFHKAIDNTNNIFDPTATNIKSLCTQKSVDCDQLLLLNIKTPKNISCRIFNNDASEALQCGNGLRAIMLYLKNSYGINEATINIADINYEVNIQDENNIRVNMGAPSFLLDNIVSDDERINIQLLSEENYFEATVVNDSNQWSFSFAPISMGNLHCIVFSQNSYDKKEAISSILNNIFNSSSNIGFILNSNEFKRDPSVNIVLRVNERGAGWTKSCGSGAASAAAFNASS